MLESNFGATLRNPFRRRPSKGFRAGVSQNPQIKTGNAKRGDDFSHLRGRNPVPWTESRPRVTNLQHGRGPASGLGDAEAYACRSLQNENQPAIRVADTQGSSGWQAPPVVVRDLGVDLFALV